MSKRPQGAKPGSCEWFQKSEHCRRPAVLWGEQGYGGLVPVFGLAADIAHGLVDQNRDLIGLLAFGDTVGFNFVGGQNLLPHSRHHAVDLDPAIGHPVVRFTA